MARLSCCSVHLCVIFKQAYPFEPAYQGSPSVCVCMCVSMLSLAKAQTEFLPNSLLLLGLVLFCSAWEWSAKCFRLSPERIIEQHCNTLPRQSCTCPLLWCVWKHLLQLYVALCNALAVCNPSFFFFFCLSYKFNLN